MAQDLKGKVALVTGGAKGIGRAIVENLARRGASVMFNYVTSDKQAHELVETLHKEGIKVVAFKADIAKVADVKKLFEETVKTFGGLDILVNNAGIFLGKPVAYTSEEEFDRIFNTNTKGVFFSLQEAAKVIRDEGRIVCISTSLTSATNIAYMSAYVGSKAAIEQFAKGIATELAAKKVTVNCISPGSTHTDMLPKEFHETGAKGSVFQRLGEPKDIADAVGFLVSEKARWITGTNLDVNGGVVMRE